MITAAYKQAQDIWDTALEKCYLITEAKTEMRETEHMTNTIVTEAEETWRLSKPKFEGELKQKISAVTEDKNKDFHSNRRLSSHSFPNVT